MPTDRSHIWLVFVSRTYVHSLDDDIAYRSVWLQLDRSVDIAITAVKTTIAKVNRFIAVLCFDVALLFALISFIRSC